MTTQEMDRLAITRILKWHWEEPYHDMPGWWVDEKGEDKTSRIREEFSPTTNEAHAAMVREKMASDGWLVSTCVDDGEWSASLWKQGSQSFVVTRDEPMMPYCLTAAALLAVGAVTEGDINA